MSRTSQDRLSTVALAGEDHGDVAESKPTQGAGASDHPTIPTSSQAAGDSLYHTPIQSDEDARPGDDEIIIQQNIIRAEEAANKPFVGDKEPLDSLKEEYLNGSSIFLQKIAILDKSHSHIRRTRGDGNCFFRSFIFGFLEYLVTSRDNKEKDRFFFSVDGWRRRLVDGGYQTIVFEDSMDLLVNQVRAINHQLEPLTLEVLLDNFRNDTVSNLVVMLLRFITACEIKQRSEFFAPFILGTQGEMMEVEQFCNRYVEPMGEESDHIHMVALTDALQVPISVLYLDNAPLDGGEVSRHDFIPEGLAPDLATPRVTLLYRPGHYDIIYPR